MSQKSQVQHENAPNEVETEESQEAQNKSDESKPNRRVWLKRIDALAKVGFFGSVFLVILGLLSLSYRNIQTSRISSDQNFKLEFTSEAVSIPKNLNTVRFVFGQEDKEGYIGDKGEKFGAKPNGFVYGWSEIVGSNQKSKNTWEFGIPTGAVEEVYVEIVTSDRVVVEGVLRSPTQSTDGYNAIKAKFKVEDGRLSIAPEGLNMQLDIESITIEYRF